MILQSPKTETYVFWIDFFLTASSIYPQRRITWHSFFGCIYTNFLVNIKYRLAK